VLLFSHNNLSVGHLNSVSSLFHRFIGIQHDWNSKTQWYWLKTSIKKVSNNTSFVRSNLVKYKSHNTNSMPKQFIKNNVRHVCVGCQLNSDQTLGLLCLKGHVRAQLDAETTPVDKKRENSCVLKHPLYWGSSATNYWGSSATKNPPKTPGNIFSHALLMSRFQNFAPGAAKKRLRCARFLKPRFAQFWLIN